MDELSGEGQPNTADVGQGSGDVSPTVLLEQLKELEQKTNDLAKTNTRLIHENKKYKETANVLKDEVSSRESTVLAEQGKWEELIEKEKNQRFDLQKKHDKLRKDTLKQKLINQVSTLAKDAVDINDVVNAEVFWDGISVDEDQLSFDGVEDSLAKVRELKPHFFEKKGAAPMANAAPGNAKPKPRTISELNINEKLDMLKAGLLAKG